MTKISSCCFDLRLTDGSLVPVSKEKLLVGSSPKCDLVLNDSSVSAYHAMIFADEDGLVTVMDLDSVNGVFVAGQRVSSRSFIGEGDTVSFGDVPIELLASAAEVAFEREDQAIQTSSGLEEKIYVPQRSSDSEALIDGEYCDIIFNENDFAPILSSPLANVTFANYIDGEELETPYDISRESDETCLMVTTLVSGTILEQTYLPLKGGSYKASGSKNGGKYLLIDVLDPKEEFDFITVSGSSISVNALEGFEQSGQSLSFDSKEVLVLTKSTFQIFIEIGGAPKELIRLPLLTREKEFWKQSGKIFASVMLPMLLLLFVDFTIEKPKDPKKLSIIYKRPTNTQMNNKAHASKEATETDKNNGHKKTEQNDKKVARSKSGQKQSKPQKAPKMAQAKSQKSPTTEKAKAPVKAYEFKLASNINSMMSDSKSAQVAKTRSPAATTTSSALSGSLDTKVNGTTSAKVGNMGSDLSGAAQSFGAKGLSGKKGMDTSYIETETVVLGSMDPELLRKILQQYLPQFRHCYQQELAYNSEDIQGIVDLNFEISGVGKVGKINVRAKDSRFSKRGINCMTKVLSIIDFPKPKGGGRVAVRQPLNFFSEKERS